MNEDQIEAELNAANSRDPRSAPWGVFTFIPAPSGMGAFYWYATCADLCDALLHHHPADRLDGMLSDRASEWSARSEQLRELADEGAGVTEATTRTAYEIAAPFFYIDWWGTFDELCTGTGTWARDLREAYRTDSESDTTPGTPLGDSEIEGFVELLRDYGH